MLNNIRWNSSKRIANFLPLRLHCDIHYRCLTCVITYFTAERSLCGNFLHCAELNHIFTILKFSFCWRKSALSDAGFFPSPSCSLALALKPVLYEMGLKTRTTFSTFLFFSASILKVFLRLPFVQLCHYSPSSERENKGVYAQREEKKKV